jgi:hypothetical protein
MLTYADIRSRKRARAAKTLLMLVWTLVDKVLSLLAFTGTKVQILTQLGVDACGQGTQFTCLYWYKVQILTQLEEQGREEVTYADVW